MADHEWTGEEDEDIVIPPPQVAKVIDKWDGEDEDDDLKDNWDDSEEEKEEENKEVKPVKKKKTLTQKIAEREAKQREEMEQKKRELEAKQGATPESILANKQKAQKLQEESDLKLAMDTFGVTESDLGPSIDRMHPSTWEDFEKFHGLLREKITAYESSGHYVAFLDNLFRDLALSLDSDSIKRLTSTLSAVANEKQKQQKAKTKKGKGKKGGSLKMDAETDILDNVYDEFDDFM